MDIISIVVHNGNRIGVVLKTGPHICPTSDKALHVRTTYDALKANGWNLTDYPYTFSNGTVSTDTLPIVDYNSLPENEKIDFGVYRGSIIPEEELRKEALSHRPIVRVAPVQVLIKTREELVNILTATSFDNPILQCYPINAITAPEALFTPEELARPENSAVRNGLEHRHCLSYSNFLLVCNFLSEHGLTGDFTYSDFLKVYFKWGISGCNAPAISMEDKEQAKQLGYDPYLKVDGQPYQIGHFLVSSAGQTFPNSTGWKLEDGIYKYRAERQLLLRTAVKYTTEQFTQIDCEGLTAKINKQYIYCTIGYENIKMRSIRVYLPFTYTEINFDDVPFCPNNSTHKKELYISALAYSLAEKMTQKLKVPSDATSYKALGATGLTESRVLYILAINSVDRKGSKAKMDADTEGPNYTDIAKNCSRFLNKDVSLAEDEEEEVLNFIEQCRDGECNIDTLAKCAAADNSVRTAQFYNYLRLAIKLGEFIDTQQNIFRREDSSLYSIIKQVCAFDPDSAESNYLDVYVGKNLISMPAYKGDNLIKGYDSVVNSKLIENLTNAKSWAYVTTVYSEPTFPGVPPKHVAMEYYRVSREKNPVILNIEQKLTSQISQFIERKPAEVKFKLVDIAMGAIANAIFYAFFFAPPKLPMQEEFQIPGKGAFENCIMSLSGSEIIALRNKISHHVESLIAYCDALYPTTCVVNARVFPEYVIPNKNVKIWERPFLQNWVTPPDAQRLRDWIAAGYIPQNHQPLERIYPADCGYEYSGHSTNSITGARTSFDNIRSHPYSLVNYVQNLYKIHADVCKTRDRYLVNLPTPATIAYPISYPTGKPINCATSQFQEKFPIPNARVLTREDFDASYPFFVESLKVHVTERVNYDDEKVTILQNFDVNDITMHDHVEYVSLYNKLLRSVRILGSNSESVVVKGVNGMIPLDKLLSSRGSPFQKVGNNYYAMFEDGRLLRVKP